MKRESDKTIMDTEGSATMRAASQIKGNNPRDTAEPERDAPFIMRKRIRSTVYEVAVHFSCSSKETLNDKILRLARNEVLNGLNEPNGDGGQK
jgi:hypothetical protein